MVGIGVHGGAEAADPIGPFVAEIDFTALALQGGDHQFVMQLADLHGPNVLVAVALRSGKGRTGDGDGKKSGDDALGLSVHSVLAGS